MYNLIVNGNTYSVSEDGNLLEFLRGQLHITSLKNGCGEGVCGACTILVDGKKTRACLLSIAKVSGKQLLTVEGLTQREKEIYTRAFSESGAVQCGFCTPGMVISAKSLLDSQPNPSSDEIKDAIRGNLCRCTGYVKIVQAIEMAAALLRGESRAELGTNSIVGMKIPRVDAREKILGTAEFVDDLYVPGMLYGAALRSRYPRAKVLSIDTSAAKNYPGVEIVLTSVDVPGQRHWGLISEDWPALVDVGEETRYIGDALVLAAADSADTARKALSLVKVEYEILDPLTTPENALKEGAPKLHPNGNLLSTTTVKRGNADEAIAEAIHVVTNNYSTPFTEHAFLEPESALAVPGENNTLTVYVGSQSIFEDHEGIVAILGVPEDKVRVILKNVGGAFGGKEDLSVQHHAALLAYLSKKPVKMTLTRQESLLTHPKRHAMDITITTACNDDGKITAVRAKIMADTGAYASLGSAVLQRACTHLGGPYQIPHVDISGYCVYTNNPPAGAFRGFGVSQAVFASELNLNQLAEAVGISPWEIRYRNAIEPGKVLPNGQIADEGTAFKETLRVVREAYEKHPHAGIACAMKNTGIGVGIKDVGRAKIRVDGNVVTVMVGASCVGQGLATVLTQIVSEILDLPIERIRVVNPDTDLTPNSGMTTASRLTLFAGEAVRLAALQVKADLVNQSWESLHDKEYNGEYDCVTDPIDSTKDNPLSHVAYGFATQVVLLDQQGKVEKVISAHDVGKAINPLAVEGQVEGGVIMGLGYALREDFPLKNSVPLARFGTLGLLRSTEIPKIEIHLIEQNKSDLAFGARGIGEITSIPTAPAVADAYYRRDGKLRFTLPLEATPYRK